MDAIKRALKKGDLKEKVIASLIMKIGFSNTEIKDLEIRNKKYNQLEKKYSKYLEDINYPDDSNVKTDSKYIWVCWLQGFENAPDIVKACIRSIIKHMPDWEVKFIDLSNFSDYMTLPEYILIKYKKGYISNAHFADLIRMELLITYGGIWIDSTVYLTDSLPDYILNSNLFFYADMNTFDTRKNYENWLIKSLPNNRVLKTIRDLMFIFWKHENKCQEYFFWNLFAYMTLNKYPEENKKIIKIPANICFLLSDNLMSSYDDVYWKEMTQLSPVHKLTYKLETNIIPEDSYIDKIIKDNI